MSAGNGPQHVKKEGDGGDVILSSSFFFLASSPCSLHRSELDHTSLHLSRDKNDAKRKNSECCRKKPSDKGIKQYKQTHPRALTLTHTRTHARTLGSAAGGPSQRRFGASALHMNSTSTHYSTAYLNKKRAQIEEH